MFYKTLFILILLAFTSFSLSFANEPKNIVIPATATCADQELQLNGYGTRKKLFLKLYIASLYVQEKQSDATQFLKMRQASCMRLYITSSKITSEKMITATREGFINATKGNTGPIEKEIETFLLWLKQPIKKGDLFEFAFVPHNTIHVLKNGTQLGVIENKEFASALFGIWLGEMPAQEKLKVELLGELDTL